MPYYCGKVNKGKMSSMNLAQNTSINQLSLTEKRWFAVYTKYKCEKHVAGHLSKKQIEVYVPFITKIKKYTRKLKYFDIPLINCYVFVCIKKSEYIPTLETEYVMKFLKQGKDLLAIPQSEIDILKRVAGDVEEIAFREKHEIQVGEEVEVISGHLTGMRGKLISRSGKRNFIIDLDTLGFQLRMNIDPELLRTLGPIQLTA